VIGLQRLKFARDMNANHLHAVSNALNIQMITIVTMVCTGRAILQAIYEYRGSSLFEK
jgi:hypothetical protein